MASDRIGALIARLGPRRLARSILSPWALVSGVVVGGTVAASGRPVFGLFAGLGAWVLGVVGALRLSRRATAFAARTSKADRVDPFGVGEPWRRFVQSSQSARTRFASAIDRTTPGPLRDSLESIGERINAAADEVWTIAKDGHALNGALRAINVTEIDQRVIAATSEILGAQSERLPALQASLDSALERQRSAQRLAAQRTSLEDRLRELDAKLGELSARGVELAVSGSVASVDPSLDTLRGEVDNVIIEMEALRQAIVEIGPATRARPSEGPTATG